MNGWTATAKVAAGAACIGWAGLCHAALVTYNFTANRTTIGPDNTTVTGRADALRPMSTITGSITFDTRLSSANATREVYNKASVLVDGVDMTSANSRALTIAVQDRQFDDLISSGYSGSSPGTPEQYDFFIFNGSDLDKALRDDDPAFPGLLPAPSTRMTYTLGFRTVAFDGTRTTANEGMEYRLSSLTLNAPAAVPLPATSLLVLAGLAALGWVRLHARG